MKIIDFERKGNVIRFYLGADSDREYWGDDWDDIPYECNAGFVYSRYVVGTADYVFPFDVLILEPSEGYRGYSSVSKEDMKARKSPCLIIVPTDLAINSYSTDYTYWLGAEGVHRIYFEDQLDSIPFGTRICFKETSSHLKEE